MQSNLKIKQRMMQKDRNHRNIIQTPIENFSPYEFSTNSSKIAHKNKNFVESPEQTFKKPPIEQKLIEKINTCNIPEEFLQKLNDFHKKHDKKINDFNNNNEEEEVEEIKEVSIGKEMDSDKRISLQNAFRRKEQESLEQVDSERFSKKMKII